MKMNLVLVPLDGSTLAEGALPRAAELAVEAGAGMLLVRATQAHPFPGADPIDAQVKVVREAEAYLAAIAARVRALGVTEVRCSTCYGPPAAAIVDAADFNHADLIVMTTHGRSGLGRLVMGSVAESVLRGTSVPILLLRDGTAPVEAPAGSAAVAGSPCRV
jgi:nucleotide-binding universal stress UspA family protein